MKRASRLIDKLILVVDDEAELRAAVAYDLKRLGAIVFEASNGLEGLNIVKNNRIEIIISDVRMPVANGIEMLKEIRKFNKTIPYVILLTGNPTLLEVDALKLGAVALLMKPIDRKRFLALIESLCVPTVITN